VIIGRFFGWIFLCDTGLGSCMPGVVGCLGGVVSRHSSSGLFFTKFVRVSVIVWCGFGCLQGQVCRLFVGTGTIQVLGLRAITIS